MKFKSNNEVFDLVFLKSEYAEDGSLAIRAVIKDTREPFANITVHMHDSCELDKNEAYLDFSQSTNLIVELIKKGYIKRGRSNHTGIFTLKFYNEII